MTAAEFKRAARYAIAVEITRPSLWERLARFFRGLM